MMLSKIKRIIPESVKARIKLFFIPVNRIHLDIKIDETKRNIYIFLCGFYQNLGDMALTYAQKTFISHEFPDSNIVLIPSYKTYVAVKYIKKHIKTDDIITVLGGGNMDDLYVSLENARLHVVREFKKNHIICFPQTYAFSDSSFGRKRERISRKVYQSHPNIDIFVREPYSLERIKRALPQNRIGYCPDIVLTLRLQAQCCERKNVLVCLREDREQLSESSFKKKLNEALEKEYKEIIKKDTVDVTREECSPQNYTDTLEKFWSLLRTCRLVVTDRLHCMIFCVINRTPCVVIDNSNHKISGVYQAWLRKIPYVKFLDNQDIDRIMSASREICGMDCSDYEYDFSEELAPLRKALHE